MSSYFTQSQRSVSVSVAMLALVIACVFLVASPLTAVAKDAGSAKPAGVPHAWKFHRTLGAQTVELSVGWTACKAEFAPTFRKYVTESPGRATITIFEEASEVPPGTHCFKSRGTHRLRVRLDRKIEKLMVFDGSFSPPKLRWPAQ